MEDFRISDMRRGRPSVSGVGRAEAKAGDPFGLPPEMVVDGALEDYAGPLQEEGALRLYWEILQRYRKTVCFIAIGIFAISLVLSSYEPDKFRAKVELLRKQEPVADQSVSLQAPSPLPISTMEKLAVSRPVMEAAMARLPEAMAEVVGEGMEIPEAARQAMSQLDAAGLTRAIAVTTDKKSGDILIIDAVVEKQALLAPAMANAVAAALEERVNSMRRGDASRKSVIIDELLKLKMEEIKTIDDEILKARREQETGDDALPVLAADEENLLKLLSEYEMLYQNTKLKQEESEEQVRAMRQELGVLGISKEQVRWEDMTSSMQKELDALRVKRSELLSRYTAKNPAVLKIEAEIHAMEEIFSPTDKNSGNAPKVVVRVDPLKIELIKNLVLYEAQLAGASIQMESVRVMRQDLNRKLIELPVKTIRIERLKRQKEVLEKLVEDLSHQYQQEKLRTGSRVSNIEIIEAATLPARPFSPNRLRIGVIGLFLGLVFGVGAAFVLNEWDNTLNATQELKRLLGLTPLGLLPRFVADEKFINPLRTADHQVEIFNMLRNNIRYSPVRDAQKCLLIASAVQREGKSFIAMNLAISFAMEGHRTLLVSVDLRQPREFLALRYGQPPKGRIKGLAEYLLGQVELADIVLDTDIDNLSVIATGAVQRNPGKLLSGQRFAELLAQLEKSYDAVIIDAPAVLPVADTTLIAPLVRGVLLVVEAGKTPVGSARQAINRLEHVGSVLVGGVLNQASNIRLDNFYGHGYALYKDETSTAD